MSLNCKEDIEEKCLHFLLVMWLFRYSELKKKKKEKENIVFKMSRLIYNLTISMIVITSYSQCMVCSP